MSDRKSYRVWGHEEQGRVYDVEKVPSGGGGRGGDGLGGLVLFVIILLVAYGLQHPILVKNIAEVISGAFILGIGALLILFIVGIASWIFDAFSKLPESEQIHSNSKPAPAPTFTPRTIPTSITQPRSQPISKYRPWEWAIIVSTWTIIIVGVIFVIIVLVQDSETNNLASTTNKLVAKTEALLQQINTLEKAEADRNAVILKQVKTVSGTVENIDTTLDSNNIQAMNAFAAACEALRASGITVPTKK